MNLIKSIGTIGGLTLVSRIAGMAREMIFARVLGANAVTDAWFQAFIIPNVFRRLFAEGAFSAAFVPMFARKLNDRGGRGENEPGSGGLEAGRAFSEDVLSVFLPLLIGVIAVFQIAMPAVIWLLADKPVEPVTHAFAIDLARIMFPYILLISLVTLLAGMLNAVSRFVPGAAFPIILNAALVIALLLAEALGDSQASLVQIGYIIALAVPVAGVLQLVWMIYCVRRAGLGLRLRRPRLTPEVRRLAIIALPAAIGGGAYQVNTLVQLYFLNQLEAGAVSWMNYADRLNQLPLGIIGIALSTAILPSLARLVGAGNREGASRLQADAIDLGMLLTLPATVALAICAEPFVTMIFAGGRFDMAAAEATGAVLAVLVLGLPAYVLVKVLVPSFYARSDTRTPLYAALASLVVFVGCNIAFLHRFGVEGVAGASALGAWINAGILYAVLAARGHFRADRQLWGRLARQALAAGAMGAALFETQGMLTQYYAAGTFQRLFALGVLVGGAVLVYFGVALALGAIDRGRLIQLMKKKAI